MPEENAASGPISDDQAARAFDEILAPRKPQKAEPAKPEVKDEKPQPARHEGDDNPEEEEPDSEEEEPDEDAEEPDEEDPEDAEVTVRIDGKNQKLKLKDLRDGYLRQADYSQKTMKLANERKAFESEMNSVKAERENYRVMLAHLGQQMDALMPQEPDWSAFLQQNGTDAFLRTKLQWDQAQKNRLAVEAERQRMDEQAQAEEQSAAETRRTEEHGRMLDAIPEWKDPKRMQKERDSMVAFARSNGFTDEDINGISDHRAVKLLRLAWIGARTLKAQAEIKPAPEPEEVKPVRPLSPAVRTQQHGMQAARDRLRRSGDDDSATAVFDLIEKRMTRRAG